MTDATELEFVFGVADTRHKYLAIVVTLPVTSVKIRAIFGYATAGVIRR